MILYIKFYHGHTCTPIQLNIINGITAPATYDWPERDTVMFSGEELTKVFRA